jgi:hydrogenase-4 component E
MNIQTTTQIIGFLAAMLLLTAFGMLVQRRIYGIIHLFAWQGLFLSIILSVRQLWAI